MYEEKNKSATLRNTEEREKENDGAATPKNVKSDITGDGSPLTGGGIIRRQPGEKLHYSCFIPAMFIQFEICNMMAKMLTQNDALKH